MSTVDGFLLLRKPRDITSFQALTPVKKLLPGTKIGHTGTLDRFADGLLVVLCGRMTRLTPLLTQQVKHYEADIVFGRETTTLDPEGEVVAVGPVPDRAMIDTVLPGFHGEIEQVPPQYSAVHVAGQRAYRAARAGQTVTIPPRKVFIESIELLRYRAPLATVRVVCSSGTYIRALARDIGRACATRAFVTRLTRTQVGPFHLEEAIEAGELQLERPQKQLRGWWDCLSRFSDVQRVTVLSSSRRTIARGGRIDDSDFLHQPRDGTLAVADERGAFLAILTRKQGKYRYTLVAPPPDS